MANTIQHKRSSTSGVAPVASGLSQGELAINIADGKFYTKNNSNSVINLGVTSISGTYITPASGNFNYLAVSGIPVSVSGHSHLSVPQAQSIVTNVFNKTASTIPKFSVVYINGGQGDQPTIQLAIANGESGSSKTYGITAEAISSMSAGSVIVAGALSGVNTDQFNPTAPVGDVNGVTLYLSPSVSGAATATKPYSPNHLVSIGTIVKTHQNQGVVEVRVQNGFELEELHNVAISGVSNGQFLYYNSSSGLWQPNTTIYSSGSNIGIGTNTPSSTLAVAGTESVFSANGDDLTYGGQPPTINLKGYTWFGSSDGSTGIGATLNLEGTFGSAADFFSFQGFNETVTAYNPICFAASYVPSVFINTDGNVGIGTATPSEALDVAGNININGSIKHTFAFPDTSDNIAPITWYNTINSINSVIAQIDVSTDGNPSEGMLVFHTNDGSTLQERLRVTDVGNVGIGTATPESKLHVTTDFSCGNDPKNNGTGMYVDGSYGTVAINDGGPTLNVLINDNGLTLYTNGGAGGSPFFYTDRSYGRIGIGTASPSETLDITGNVNIDGDLKFDSFTESVVSNGNSGTSKTLSLASGTVHTCTLTGNCTFTMPTSIAGKSFTMFLNSGSGNYTASFSGVRWADSATPTATILANKVDIYSFISDGSYWYGSFSQNYG